MKKLIFSLIMISTLTIVAFASYNQTSAAAYALTYAKKYNKQYKYYSSGDCTNFISQALKAGGIRYDTRGNAPFQKWHKYSDSWIWASTFRLRAKNGGFGAKKIRRDQLGVGDVVVFDWVEGPRTFQHVAMVANVTISYFWGIKKYYVSYHTRDRKNIILSHPESKSRRVEYYRPR